MSAETCLSIIRAGSNYLVVVQSCVDAYDSGAIRRAIKICSDYESAVEALKEADNPESDSYVSTEYGAYVSERKELPKLFALEQDEVKTHCNYIAERDRRHYE